MSTDSTSPRHAGERPFTTVGDAVGGMARGSSLNIVGAVCQQASMLLATALIARALGSGALGRYSIAYAMLTVLGLLTQCGFRATLTRFVAIHLAENDAGSARGVVRLCVTTGFALSVVAAVALFVFAAPIATLFHDPHMRLGLQCVAVALPATALRDLGLAATQGWRMQRSFTLIGWIGEPLLRLVITVIALAAGCGLQGAYLALVVGAWAAALATLRAVCRRTRTLRNAAPAYRLRSILEFSLVSWATTLASSGLLWADTLLLGHFASSDVVGMYTVGTRLVSLAIFVMAPINAAFAPHFAHTFHQGDLARAGRLYTAATGWILRLSLPAFALVIAFPDGLLRVFGSSYTDATAVTVLLGVGQLVNALTGPCGTALNMSGRVRLNLANNVAVLAVNVALNLWLIPRHGAVGAAAAWCVSLGAVNLARLAEVYGVVRMWPFSLNTLKALVAGCLSAVVSLAAVAAIRPWLLHLVLGAAIVIACYVVVTLALGLEPHERAAVGALRRRIRAA